MNWVKRNASWLLALVFFFVGMALSQVGLWAVLAVGIPLAVAAGVLMAWLEMRTQRRARE